MKIRIDTPASFLPERSYAIRMLFQHFLGLEADIRTSDQVDRYIVHCPSGELRMEDVFFADMDEQGSYTRQNLPTSVRVESTPDGDGILSLYGSGGIMQADSHWECGVDVVGGTFFMLARWEETLENDTDEHGRAMGSASVLGKLGENLRPVVDEYCLFLKQMLTRLGVPEQAFRVDTFRIDPTCDLDYPFYYRSSWHALQRTASKVLDPFRILRFAREAREAVAFIRDSANDPYAYTGYMMDCAEQNGQTMMFYLMAGSGHQLDPPLQLGSPRLEKVLEEITMRGHRIGFHPSYLTVDQPELFFGQWEVLKSAVPGVERACRQHFLRFRNPVSWQMQAECGMTSDSTLGYADLPGFRCGTSKPFPVFDIEARKQLDLVETPLLLMDVTLKNYMGLDKEDAVGLADQLKQTVQKHNGHFVFLWHNSSFERDGWEAYNGVFERVVQP